MAGLIRRCPLQPINIIIPTYNYIAVSEFHFGDLEDISYEDFEEIFFSINDHGDVIIKRNPAQHFYSSTAYYGHREAHAILVTDEDLFLYDVESGQIRSWSYRIARHDGVCLQILPDGTIIYTDDYNMQSTVFLKDKTINVGSIDGVAYGSYGTYIQTSDLRYDHDSVMLISWGGDAYSMIPIQNNSPLIYDVRIAEYPDGKITVDTPIVKY